MILCLYTRARVRRRRRRRRRARLPRRPLQRTCSAILAAVSNTSEQHESYLVSPPSPSSELVFFWGWGLREASTAPPISADGCARPIATAPRHRGVAWIFLNNNVWSMCCQLLTTTCSADRGARASYSVVLSGLYIKCCSGRLCGFQNAHSSPCCLDT